MSTCVSICAFVHVCPCVRVCGCVCVYAGDRVSKGNSGRYGQVHPRHRESDLHVRQAEGAVVAEWHFHQVQIPPTWVEFIA